ncbi:LacI family DNA-binding transcriptional regulator [Formosa algae]|uniref:LacI family transcriptional regulator n=1 Tax=Formosa algae TaxID=225843 RepID=A0A9X0YMR3_9FLAO|nr:LacI family DNA-binding transcriptional regulator [Formosa algae]MBP1841612.1 LacI family transcriptional regulator [Formosa algae]MDQ0336995.1 LacI family transcriptional regulator [Formosa algae]OEI80237.1 LacI family transcriptional regulator [Formosa algae]PNW26540.1 LacI family transcriptional regulator [Formosa algae]
MKNKRKTTIKDIANVLNITPSAVSRALHNHPRISDKTKAAVKKVAKELDYQPNHLASALRSGKSKLVGIIVAKTNSYFFSSVVENIESELNKKGYNLIITQSNESFEKECRNIDALLQTQVDGIIASLANETVTFDHYNKIKEKGIPLILFDRGENDIGVDYVGIDDYQSSNIVVNHLVEQGCKRIAHIAGYSHTRIYKNRIRGYKDALKKHELPEDEDLLLEGSLSIEDGRAKMEQLLKLPILPDAVYAAGDYAALGALQVLQEHNIKVPEQIALVGFSNEPFTSLVSPSISSIYQHNKEIGKLVAKQFLLRVNDKNYKPVLHKSILEPELIIRDSSRKLK